MKKRCPKCGRFREVKDRCYICRKIIDEDSRDLDRHLHIIIQYTNSSVKKLICRGCKDWVKYGLMKGRQWEKAKKGVKG